MGAGPDPRTGRYSDDGRIEGCPAVTRLFPNDPIIKY
jgi:hypothetical protein